MRFHVEFTAVMDRPQDWKSIYQGQEDAEFHAFLRRRAANLDGGVVASQIEGDSGGRITFVAEIKDKDWADIYGEDDVENQARGYIKRRLQSDDGGVSLLGINITTSSDTSPTNETTDRPEVSQRVQDRVSRSTGPVGALQTETMDDGTAAVTFADGSSMHLIPNPDHPDRFRVKHFTPSGENAPFLETRDRYIDETDELIRSYAVQADPGLVTPWDQGPVPEGLYSSGDHLYRVQKNTQTGRLVTQRLREDGGWSPAKESEIKGGYRAHMDEIAERGRANGRCVICGRPLSGDSASKGIGPKCAADYSR